MKIVINAGYGGFGLSDVAAEYCMSKGMTCTHYTPEGIYADKSADFVESNDKLFGKYHLTRNYDKEPRCNPIIIEAVETLGKKANANFAKLKIIEIPFETTEGWHIAEYDGWESIEEDHKSWD